MQTTGERIRLRRQQLGLNQEELADMVGTNQRQISHYENGKNDPTGQVLLAIANALDVSADWLLGRTNIMKPFYQGEDLAESEIELLEIYRSKAPDKQSQLIEIAKVV